jgi:DNA-binding MarR family transcriptional regulator
MQADVDRLISETVVAVFSANGRMVEWGDAFAAPFGLTSARWQILGGINWSAQKPTAPQIAERMGVSRQGAQKQLNLLVDDGLIEKLSNPAHRRSPFYRLTARGAALLGQVNSAWEAHVQAISPHLPSADLETTLRVLGVLTALHAPASEGEGDET